MTTKRARPAAGNRKPKEQKRRAKDGSQLLDEVEQAIRRYVVLPSEHAYVALTLWIAATHGVDQWEHAPRLALVSPEKRCGKSRCLDVAEYLSHEPLASVNASVAAVVRSIKKKSPPTIFVDEADAIFGSKRAAETHDELRGILNAGHQRGRFVTRWDVTTRSLEKLETFAMVALASIRDLPDTIMDRAVVIRMRRKANDESVVPFRHKRDGTKYLAPLRERLAVWMGGQKFPDEVAAMPVEDRAADTWEPLIAVADAAGGGWPERARVAAKDMTEAEAEIGQESFGVELLRDIRSIWPKDEEGRYAEATHTHDLLTALHSLEEAPWGDYHGNPLTPHDLGRLLKPYGVFSVQVKLRNANLRGYRLDGKFNKATKRKEGGLYDAWQRYLPPAAGSAEVADS